MEILFEIAAVVLQFLGELLFQMLFELLAELGLHSVREVFRRPEPTSPALAAIGYAILGASAGWLSLLLLPTTLIHHAAGRVINLVLTPIGAGLLMSVIGAWRLRRDQELIRLDRFGYGFLFALGTTVVRFIWARDI
jgi:multisubunit Na+/H+ antiporter MnhG subunit